MRRSMRKKPAMKNNLWFKHDYGARNDPKLKRLVSRKGPGAGYVWWVIVEMLHEEGGRLPKDYYEEIAYDTHSDVEMVRYVVEESGLFQSDKKNFWSARQIRDMEEAQRIKERNRAGGIKSGESRRNKQIGNQEEIKYTSSILQEELNDTSNQTGSTLELNKQTYIQTNKQIDNPDSVVSGDGSEEKTLFEGLDIPAKGKYDDAKRVFDMWNEAVSQSGGSLPKVKVFESRKEQIRQTLDKLKEVGDPIQVAKILIEKAFNSERFRNGTWGSFDWIFRTKTNNWCKLYEGNYDNNRTNDAQAGHERLHNAAQSPEEFKGRFYISPKQGGNSANA